MVSGHGELNLAAAARGLKVPNATRACDRLVGTGLLSRHEDRPNRRNLVLELTGEGQRLVETTLDHRRRAVDASSPACRMSAVRVLCRFCVPSPARGRGG
jgi:DNA-binding MarR family transcriptional regulator